MEIASGERKTIFYINIKTGDLIAEKFYKQQQDNPDIKPFKESPKQRRIEQRFYFGSNNRRKMHNLPKYRKPAWSRRKKK